MALPQIPEYTVPLLLELERADGAARPSDIYEPVLSHFPRGLVSDSDLNEPQPSGRPGRYKNLIQNAKELLKQSGDIEARPGGAWPITAKGRQTLRQKLIENHGVPQGDVERAIASDLKLYQIDASWQPRVTGPARTAGRKAGSSRGTVIPASGPPLPAGAATTGRSTAQPSVPAGAAQPAESRSSLSQLVAEHFDQVRLRLANRISHLSAEQFEHLVAQFLRSVGYEDVRRTGGPGDRNIDVTGVYSAPFVQMSIRVQVKHRQSAATVGPTDVAAFRDRAGGADYVLLMVTNGRFTDGAIETACEPDRQHVYMINGQELLDAMMQKRIGVKEGSLGLLDIAEEFFIQFEGAP